MRSGAAYRAAWRAGACAAAALAALPFPAAGQSVVPHAIASNGVVVPMPDIATLDCAGMTEALRRIDQSNYRDAELLTEEDRDWPIFVYEDRLARVFYTECMLRERAMGDPGEAFSFGFEAQ